MKWVLSGRVVGLVLVVVLFATVINVCLVVNVYSSMYDVGQTDGSGFDFIVSQDGLGFLVKDTVSKRVVSGFESASIAINYAFSVGDSVFLKGTFNLTSDIVLLNRLNAKLVGDNAIINANGYAILVCGDNYTLSKYPLVSGLVLNNGTLRVVDTFGATVTDMLFQDCRVGLEFVNINKWTEGSKVENCHFVNCCEGIAFRSPIGGATGSYESTDISRCFFNQYDNSVAINVESQVELSCSQLRNIRIWIGEYGNINQTGLRMAGTMSQTLLTGVVFESFSDAPDMLYGIAIESSANASPILNGAVSFLGMWSDKIHNPLSIWISASSCVFDREDLPVSVGLNGTFGEKLTIIPTPLKVVFFKPKIDVQGSFIFNESIKVRIQIEYIDSYTTSIEKTFTTNSTIWLTDDELLELFPSQNIAWDVIVDASCNTNNTDATVKISGYGIAG